MSPLARIASIVVAAIVFTGLAALFFRFEAVAHQSGGLVQSQAAQASFVADLRGETNSVFFVPRTDVFGKPNGYAASGTPCNLPYLGDCGDLKRVLAQPDPTRSPVPISLISYNNAPHEFDSWQTAIPLGASGAQPVRWTAYYFNSAAHEIQMYHYTSRNVGAAVSGLTAPIQTYRHVAWMGAGMLLASETHLAWPSSGVILTGKPGWTPLCNDPTTPHLYLAAFHSAQFDSQYADPAALMALANNPCWPFDSLTQMGGSPDVIGGSIGLYVELQSYPAGTTLPKGYNPVTGKGSNGKPFWPSLRRGYLVLGAFPPMPRVVTTYYGNNTGKSLPYNFAVCADSTAACDAPNPNPAPTPAPTSLTYTASSPTTGTWSSGNTVQVAEEWVQGFPWAVTDEGCGSGPDVVSLITGANVSGSDPWTVASTQAVRAAASPTGTWPTDAFLPPDSQQAPQTPGTMGYTQGPFSVAAPANLTQSETCSVVVSQPKNPLTTLPGYAQPTPVTVTIHYVAASTPLAVVPGSLVYPAPGEALFYDSSGGFFSGAQTPQTQDSGSPPLTPNTALAGRGSHSLSGGVRPDGCHYAHGVVVCTSPPPSSSPPPPTPTPTPTPAPTAPPTAAPTSPPSTGSLQALANAGLTVTSTGDGPSTDALCPENVPVVVVSGPAYGCDYGNQPVGTTFTGTSTPNAVSVSGGSRSDTYAVNPNT
ncbi:MAG: hypothetical protein ACYDGM_13605, partial [Vulcanimicrobiaceae bacterium]